MREQLGHLLALSERPNVTVQVVTSSGEHAANGSSFVIATMADMSRIAYVETALRGLTTDDPADLATLSHILVDLRDRAFPGVHVAGPDQEGGRGAMDMTDLVWRRSTRSLSNGGECVEVAGLPDGAAVRDSKDPYGPVLVVSRAALRTAVRAFVSDRHLPAR